MDVNDPLFGTVVFHSFPCVYCVVPFFIMSQKAVREFDGKLMLSRWLHQHSGNTARKIRSTSTDTRTTWGDQRMRVVSSRGGSNTSHTTTQPQAHTHMCVFVSVCVCMCVRVCGRPNYVVIVMY